MTRAHPSLFLAGLIKTPLTVTYQPTKSSYCHTSSTKNPFTVTHQPTKTPLPVTHQVETEKLRTDETRQLVMEAVATSSNAWQKQLSEEHMRMMASEQRWEEEALFRKKVQGFFLCFLPLTSFHRHITLTPTPHTPDCLLS